MGVFTQYRYKGTIRLYQMMLEAAFEDLKVKIGDKLVVVPIFSVSGERTNGALATEGKESTVDNVFPRSRFKFVDMQADDDRQANINASTFCPASGTKYEVPTAKIFQYEYLAITKTRNQALQIIEQVTQVFNPYRVFRLKEYSTQSKPVEVRIAAEFRPMDDNHDDVDEAITYQVNFVFSVYGYVYGLTDIDGDIIEKIIIQYNNTGDMSQTYDTLLKLMEVDEDGATIYEEEDVE